MEEGEEVAHAGADQVSPPTGNCRRTCLVLVCLLGAFLAAGWAALRATWEGRVEAALARVEAEGLSLEGLNPPPKGENGVHELIAARDSLTAALPEDVLMMRGSGPRDLAKALEDADPFYAEIVYTQDLPGSPKSLPEALDLLVRALEEIDPQVESALGKEVVWGEDFATKGVQTDFELLALNELLGCLIVRSGHRMIRGEPEAAYSDLETCLALVATAPPTPLISRIVRDATLAQAVHALAGLLALGPAPGGEQHSRILRSLQAFERDFGLTLPLLGELHCARLLNEEQFRAEVPRKDRVLGQVWTGAWRAGYFEALADSVMASRRPRAEFHAYLEELRRRRGGGPFVEQVVFTHPRVFDKNLRIQAEVRLVIRLLELATQPGELPQALRNMPFDPCVLDRARCRYRLDEDGAVLWSVGSDGVDQAGVRSSESEGATDDLSFKLPRRR